MTNRSAFSSVLRGAGWMLGSQVIIGVGQFSYSALTARAFSPEEFGNFAAALSLQGILVLLSITGLTSYILREPVLENRNIRWIWIFALTGSLISIFLFVFLSPFWLDLFHAGGGRAYVPLLVVSLVAVPFMAVQSALLRREGRATLDSILLLFAFLIANGVAGVAIFWTRQTELLALPSVLNPAVLGITAFSYRRTRYRRSGGDTELPSGDHRFVVGVTVQNAISYVVGQSPGWIVGMAAGAGALGQFGRANTLAGTPGQALTTALNRVVQPYWRRIPEARNAVNAIADAILLSSGVAFPSFAILAVLAPELTRLWLGPGWEVAGGFGFWLAIGFGFQVPFTIVANFLEMMGHLRAVRRSQFMMLLGLFAGLAAFLVFQQAVWICVGFSLASLLAMLSVVASAARVVGVNPWLFTRRLLHSLVWGCVTAGVAFLTLVLIDELALSGLQVLQHLSVVWAGLVAIVFWIASFRLQPSSKILQERGVNIPIIGYVPKK